MKMIPWNANSVGVAPWRKSPLLQVLPRLRRARGAKPAAGEKSAVTNRPVHPGHARETDNNFTVEAHAFRHPYQARSALPGMWSRVTGSHPEAAAGF